MKRAMVLFCAFCLTSIAPFPLQADDIVRDGVFVHISHGSDDPHRLLMALNMAKIMADDHDVLVYIDIKGVDAVLKDSPDEIQIADKNAFFDFTKGRILTLDY